MKSRRNYQITMTPRVKGIRATATATIAIVVVVLAALGFILLTPPSMPQATAQTSSTSSTGPSASYSTASNYPVEVITLTGPIPPYPIGEFQVVISLMNVGDTPITSLNATLGWVPPPGSPGGTRMQYPFVFSVSSFNPLLPGQNITTKSTFVGPDLEGGLHYPLTLSGTAMNGTQFSYTENVLFVRFDL